MLRESGKPHPRHETPPPLQLRPQTQLSCPQASPPTPPSHIPDLAPSTAPQSPEDCLPGVLRMARGGAEPRLQAAGWQAASSASAGGEAAAPPSGPLS